MGWSYGWSTKQGLIHHLTGQSADSPGFRTVASCYRGGRFSGVLWAVFHSVHKDGSEHSFIACFLMHCRQGEWGYKDMEESMGPCYYSCPLSYLDMAPEENHEWREKVREWHSIRNKKLTIGQTYAARSGLTLGCVPIHTIRVDSLKPLRGTVFNENGYSLGQTKIKRTFCLA